MRGLHLDAANLAFREDLPEPRPGDGDTVVDVLQAGICATDLALSRGYMGFSGVPGHEFVGVARGGPLDGQRVVGDINAACGACATCAAGDPHHCPNRTVLGILRHSGAFAERLCLPTRNLLPVPGAVSSDAATFVEPLAAALEIGEQIEVGGARALVAGDGKLGLLCAWALHLGGAEATVAGRHPERRGLLPAGVELRTGLLDADARAPASRFDVAVEATGHPAVLPRLLRFVRPRGTLVLKTTTESATGIDLSPLVVDEITMVGSRCGPFAKALEALAAGAVPVEDLIAARYPLREGEAAFAAARAGSALKILLDVAPV